MTAKALKASTSTCHWGFFDASLSPAVTIESGDEIIIDTISGGPMNLPGAGFHVPPELLEMHAQGVPSMPGHLLTGPVGISGAKAGDVLKVDILTVSLIQDWGFNFLGPLKGTLPHDFPNVQHTIIPLDAERGVGTLPWGLELELAPFFGVMGVAPPAQWGRISTIEPRMHGGISTTKSSLRAQRFTYLFSSMAPCFHAVMDTVHKAMVRFALLRLRLLCRAAFV